MKLVRTISLGAVVVLSSVALAIWAGARGGSGKEPAGPSSLSPAEPASASVPDVHYIELFEHPEEYRGRRVRTAGPVAQLEEDFSGGFYLTFTDGFGGLSSMVRCELSSAPPEGLTTGDIVIVTGVGGAQSLGIYTLEQASVEQSGSTAEALYSALEKDIPLS